ncbi:MAG TPA: hypothetical protein VF808_03735 [Ktedonobacterales bacterium]
MPSTRSAKPLVSALLALLLVLALIVPFLSTSFLAGKTTPLDVVQAGAIHWGIVIAFFVIWLGVQLFWNAPTEATKLGMAISATIVWLSLTLFFNFHNEAYGGPVAFFALTGGLGVVLLWTRFLADEINF